MKKMFFVLMMLSSFASEAQNIIIDDSLAGNSVPLKVKMGTQNFGSIWNIRFGVYGVRSSKMGWTTSSSRTNIFNARTNTSVKQKFSFSFSGKDGDTAFVNAARDVNLKAIQFEILFPEFSIESKRDLDEKENLFAMININRDTARLWSLYLSTRQGAKVRPETDAFITGEGRRIDIVPVTSDIGGTDKRSVPAMGYQFFEGMKIIGAVQYYAGGLLGSNKNIVWIHEQADAQIKLLLGAAITAILQVKTESLNSSL